jgi:quinone-modifying oxidoreductase, subunit QmoC
MVAKTEHFWEEKVDTGFLDEVFAIPGGKKIRACIQCGTCSGSCPMSPDMDYSPRQIFAMTRAGLKESVLSSNAIWLCTACYSCAVRCPKDIKITDIMYKLKQLSIKHGLKNPTEKRQPVLMKQFVNVVRRFGRSHERTLLTHYFLATGIFSALGYIGLGWRLFSKGRLPIFGKRIAGIKEVRQIMDYCQKKEEVSHV